MSTSTPTSNPVHSLTNLITSTPPPSTLSSSPSLLASHILKVITLLSHHESTPVMQYLMYWHVMSIIGGWERRVLEEHDRDGQQIADVDVALISAGTACLMYNVQDCVRVLRHVRNESLNAESREVAQRLLKEIEERVGRSAMGRRDAKDEDEKRNNALEEESASRVWKLLHEHLSSVKKRGGVLVRGAQRTLVTIVQFIQQQITYPEKLETLTSLERNLRSILHSHPDLLTHLLPNDELVEFCETNYHHQNVDFVCYSMRIVMHMMRILIRRAEGYSSPGKDADGDVDMGDAFSNGTFTPTHHLAIISQALCVRLQSFCGTKDLLKLCKVACSFMREFAPHCPNSHLITQKIRQLLSLSTIDTNSLRTLSITMFKITPYDSQSFKQYSAPLLHTLQERLDSKFIEQHDRNVSGTYFKSIIAALLVKYAHTMRRKDTQFEDTLKQILSALDRLKMLWTLYSVAQQALELGFHTFANQALTSVIHRTSSENSFYWIDSLLKWTEAELCKQRDYTDAANGVLPLTAQLQRFKDAYSSMIMCPAIDESHSFQKHLLQLRTTFTEIMVKCDLLMRRLGFVRNVGHMIELSILQKNFGKIFAELRAEIEELVNFCQSVIYSFFSIDIESVRILQSFCDLCQHLRIMIGCLFMDETYSVPQGATKSIVSTAGTIAAHSYTRILERIVFVLQKLQSAERPVSLKARVEAFQDICQHMIQLPFQIPPFFFAVTKTFSMGLEIRLGKNVYTHPTLLTVDSDEALSISLGGIFKYDVKRQMRNNRKPKYVRNIIRCFHGEDLVGTYITKSKCEKDAFQALCVVHLPQETGDERALGEFTIMIETQIVDNADISWDLGMSIKPAEIRVRRRAE